MTRLFRISVSLLCLVMVVGTFPILPVHAQSDQKQVDELITQLMSTYNVPGVSIALVKDGKVFYVKGYGVRNTNSGQPVTEHTRFAIGSVTKSFTALDVSQQVDAGKLDLATPVIHYLPNFKLSDADATKALTLRNLLTHTSGLPRSEDWYFNRTTSREQVIKDMANITLTAPVGKVWQYNNQNFVLAGYLVEKVTGQSWEDYTQAHVLQPLGMADADFDVSIMQKSSDYASPHALDMLKGMQPIPFFGSLGAIGPAGSINASAQDMSQYLLLQLSDGTLNGKTIVSKNMLQMMHTEQISIGPAAAATAQATALATPAATQPASATESQSLQPLVTNFGYGFGWITEDYRGYHLVTHDGSIDGFYSEIVLIPSANAGLVILTNADKAVQFAEVASFRLTEWLLGLQPDRDLVAYMNKSTGFDPAQLKSRMDAARAYQADPQALNALAGDYTGPVGKITASVQNGKLHLYVESQKIDVELIQFDADSYLANNPVIAGTLFTIKTDAQGTTTISQDVYGQMVQVGQRLGANVKSVMYADPKDRFSFAVPPGLVVNQSGDLAVIQSADPKGTFVIAAKDATASDLKTEVQTWLKSMDSTFANDPVNIRDVALNGATWTQFLYQLPSQQLLAVVAVKQGNTVYFVTLQAQLDAIQTLTPAFTNLLLSFKMGK